MYAKIILLLFIPLTSLHASAIGPQNTKLGLSELFSDVNLKISKKETRIASNFHKLYKLANNGIVNTSLMRSFYRDVNSSSTFKLYKHWPKSLIKLSKVKKLKSIKSFCEKQKASEYTNLMRKQLNENIIHLCFNKYLNRLSLNHSKTLYFHRKETEFIKFNTNHILTKPNFTEIEYLLSRFKRGSSKHKLYSKTILNYYEMKKLTPPKELLKYVHITPRHTRFLQTLDIDKNSTQYVFYKEFKTLKKIAFELLDKKADSKEIISSFMKAYNYYRLTYQYQPKERATLTLLSLSKSLMRRGFHTQAQLGFKQILSHEDYKYSSTLFSYMWSFISQKQYSESLALIDSYKVTPKFLEKNPKINFWIGFINQKLGKETIAKQIFKNVINDNLLSYYAILSAKLLGEDYDQKANEIYEIALNSSKNRIKISNSTVDVKWLKRVILWAKFHQSKFLSLELKEIQNIKTTERVENHILSAAYFLSQKEEYLESFKIIYKSINNGNIKLSENTLKILFPKPYLMQVTSNTKSFDPIIAMSLIRQESGFNTRARSHVGARGLMQLMPNTAKRFKKRLKKKHLYNASLNIKIGTKYFSKLLNRYDNNLVYSLAAYNAGERRVDEWQEDYLTSTSMLENIENIPFLETRKYVKLIFRNMFFYKMILNDKKNDSENLNHIYDIKLGFKT